MHIWAPLILAVAPSSIGTGSLFLAVTFMAAVACLGLYVGLYATFGRSPSAHNAVALYAAVRNNAAQYYGGLSDAAVHEMRKDAVARLYSSAVRNGRVK